MAISLYPNIVSDKTTIPWANFSSKSSVLPGSSTINTSLVTKYGQLCLNNNFSANSTSNITTLATSSQQAGQCFMLATPPLKTQTILNGYFLSWTATESAAAANIFVGLSFYSYNPSTQQVATSIYDSFASFNEAASSGSGIDGVGLSGYPDISVGAGHQLIVEVWYTATQSMATSYTGAITFTSLDLQNQTSLIFAEDVKTEII